jgi:ribosomal protein S18 acetylase RimI-like enzyme
MMSREPLTLASATASHLLQMMSWFPSAESCRTWGGPEFRFPFTAETFQADCQLPERHSFALLEAGGVFCGFGQYYLRAGRCHLARLAIAPACRGRGFGTRLIELLACAGKAALGVEQCSLFVSAANTSALALYQRLGFTRTDYPAGPGVAGVYYMVR